MPVVVARLADDLIKGTFSGHVDGDDVASMHNQMKLLMEEKPARFLFIDTEPVTGFNPNVSVPGVAFLKDLKRLGIQRSVAIAPMSGVRMMGSAVALGAGLSMRFVENDDAAVALLAEWRAKP